MPTPADLPAAAGELLKQALEEAPRSPHGFDDAEAFAELEARLGLPDLRRRFSRTEAWVQRQMAIRDHFAATAVYLERDPLDPRPAASVPAGQEVEGLRHYSTLGRSQEGAGFSSSGLPACSVGARAEPIERYDVGGDVKEVTCAPCLRALIVRLREVLGRVANEAADFRAELDAEKALREDLRKRHDELERALRGDRQRARAEHHLLREQALRRWAENRIAFLDPGAKIPDVEALIDGDPELRQKLVNLLAGKG